MGQHATMHVKSTESFNGQDGKWLPARSDASGNISIALVSGELQQFNRLAGGAIAQYTSVSSADTLVATGPCILYGVVLIAAGTMANVYDNTSAAGTIVIPSTTASVNFSGVGLLMNNGIYADWTSGTWLVVWAPAV